MKYVLIEVIERNISIPEFFGTFEEAHAEMKRRYEQAARCDDSTGLFDINDFNGGIIQWEACCENDNHDNCDWKIFEI